MLRPGYDWQSHIKDDTYSIHFYGRRMRARLLDKFDGVPKPRSLIGQLVKKQERWTTRPPRRCAAMASPEADTDADD